MKFKEDDFVSILNNKKEFQVAFHLFHGWMLSKNFGKIFKDYTISLLKTAQHLKNN